MTLPFRQLENPRCVHIGSDETVIEHRNGDMCLTRKPLTSAHGLIAGPTRRAVGPFCNTSPVTATKGTAQAVCAEMDPFVEMMTELSDGLRWKLTRADGWDDFVDRLSRMLPELSLRRRQAMVMVLFALTEKLLTPDQLSRWLVDHDATSEAGLEDFLSWLRSLGRPGPTEPTDPRPDEASTD
jgi:hypothetical protein